MYEDRGEEVAHETLCASVWPGSPFGRPICGTKDTVSAMTVDGLRRYRERHYAPSRLLAVVAGGFDLSLIHILSDEAALLAAV